MTVSGAGVERAVSAQRCHSISAARDPEAAGKMDKIGTIWTVSEWGFMKQQGLCGGRAGDNIPGGEEGSCPGTEGKA